MRRGVLSALAAIGAFLVVAAVMLKMMPAPVQNADYLVIGSVATLVSLLVLFRMLVARSMKSPDMFFKRRKK